MDAKSSPGQLARVLPLFGGALTIFSGCSVRREEGIKHNVPIAIPSPVVPPAAPPDDPPPMNFEWDGSRRRPDAFISYGCDDRVDVVSHDDSVRRGLGDSVFALFDYKDVSPSKNEPARCTITSQRLGEKYDPVCERPKVGFLDEPTGALCTAFLVKPNVAITAAHCICDDKSKKCSRMYRRKFVLGYQNSSSGSPADVPCDSVYEPVKILAWKKTKAKEDYAVVLLDRSAPDTVKPLELSNADPVEDEGVFIIGHPFGLPQKIAINQSVSDVKDGRYFLAKIDAFGGNSGSPVFSKDNKVVGVFRGGAADMAWDDKDRCNKMCVCNEGMNCENGARRGEVGVNSRRRKHATCQRTCRGEVVTVSSRFSTEVPP